MSGCSVEGCDRKAAARGWCHKHWGRWRSHGDPNAEVRLFGEENEVARFWQKVDVRSPDECWEWTAKSKKEGYGSFGVKRDGKFCKILAHRYSWQLSNGPIPKGEGPHGTVIMHICDNPGCVNPAHLAAATQADNVHDMCAKGRKVNSVKSGEDHPRSRFTADDIRYIRSSQKSGNAIAKEYGCNRGVINGIRRRVTWRHIE